MKTFKKYLNEAYSEKIPEGQSEDEWLKEKIETTN